MVYNSIAYTDGNVILLGVVDSKTGKQIQNFLPVSKLPKKSVDEKFNANVMYVVMVEQSDSDPVVYELDEVEVSGLTGTNLNVRDMDDSDRLFIANSLLTRFENSTKYH